MLLLLLVKCFLSNSCDIFFLRYFFLRCWFKFWLITACTPPWVCCDSAAAVVLLPCNPQWRFLAINPSPNIQKAAQRSIGSTPPSSLSLSRWSSLCPGPTAVARLVFRIKPESCSPHVARDARMSSCILFRCVSWFFFCNKTNKAVRPQV